MSHLKNASQHLLPTDTTPAAVSDGGGSPIIRPMTDVPPLARKFTLADIRAARAAGAKVPMLTCYDFTTAKLMQQAGVPALLVGDSAANVILGHDTTLPVPLHFMIQIT